MGTVTVEVNGQNFTMGCADGQERRLQELARGFDRTVREVSDQVGAIGDLRLVVMASLTVVDELADARAQLARVHEETRAAHDAGLKVEARAAAALDAAARRLEEMTQKLEGGGA